MLLKTLQARVRVQIAPQLCQDLEYIEDGDNEQNYHDTYYVNDDDDANAEVSENSHNLLCYLRMTSLTISSHL